MRFKSLKIGTKFRFVNDKTQLGVWTKIDIVTAAKRSNFSIQLKNPEVRIATPSKEYVYLCCVDEHLGPLRVVRVFAKQRDASKMARRMFKRLDDRNYDVDMSDFPVLRRQVMGGKK